MAKISELPKNEQAYYRMAFSESEKVLGGYENAELNGEDYTTPTLDSVLFEVWAEVECLIRNSHDTQLHFIGKDRMNSLLKSAVKNAFKRSEFEL